MSAAGGLLAVGPEPDRRADVRRELGWRRCLISGAAAGAVSALAFTALHRLLISDIWSLVVPMAIAGALCGVCLAWSYGRMFRPPSAGSWLLYNLVHVVLLVLLGIASILVFEPITTVPALMAANEAPRELIWKAMPLSAVFIPASSALIGIVWGRNIVDVLAILLTCTLLVVLLGSNVSLLGLVELPSGSIYLVARMFALIAALSIVYLVAFLGLERGSFGLRVERDGVRSSAHRSAEFDQRAT